ncbi:MAG: cisplatin damage response ATP-dependent DNA ligase [Verrucomicrobiota bacterium]
MNPGFHQLAQLIEQLLFSPSRNAKLALLAEYFHTAPAQDRGYGLALLTGELPLDCVRASQLRKLVTTKVDEELFRLSYAYVGDLGETIALIWPPAERTSNAGTTDFAELIQRIQSLTPLERFPFIDHTLDELSETERWVFIKLLTGSSLRIGVSARLAKQGLAQAFEKNVDDIERIWSAFEPPYPALFDWLEGRTDEPELPDEVFFHPPMLAPPLDEAELEQMAPSDYAAEWKWDGIRVQLTGDGDGKVRLFSRSGDDISEAFPEITGSFTTRAVVDAELLIRHESLQAMASELPGVLPDVASFNQLQQRLNRKQISAQLLVDSPAMLCCYDLLFQEGEDLREWRWVDRRTRLESWYQKARLNPLIYRISSLLPVDGWNALNNLRQQSRAAEMEGVMLKRKDSRYLPGRPKGHWFKWKRDPLNIDTVMLYAQRGHGKRSSYYSDYTFGVWCHTGDAAPELVPVGKAYSGFTDEELVRLDQWIRQHTTERYGASVRAVEPELVLEVIFDDLRVSGRHRSGVAMRFPRIHRIRWDKPAAEAGTLAELRQLGGIK